MSRCAIPVVLCDEEFRLEQDALFLRCIHQHPNLYDEGHKYYNDEIMIRSSWGLIAKDNTITVSEAKEKWKDMMNQFLEEDNLQLSATCCDNSVEGIEPSFPHYSFMKKMIFAKNETNPTGTQTTKPVKKEVNHLNMGLKKLKTLTSRVKQSIKTLEQTDSSDMSTSNANVLVGKVIFNELQNLISEKSQHKRQLLLQCILQIPGSTSSNIVENQDL